MTNSRATSVGGSPRSKNQNRFWFAPAADGAREAFEQMAANLDDKGPLSPKQRAWAHAALKGDRYDPEPEYENLVSSGRVPRGREVQLLVKDKPLRPPTRRSET